jgi:hypothetical protein
MLEKLVMARLSLIRLGLPRPKGKQVGCHFEHFKKMFHFKYLKSMQFSRSQNVPTGFVICPAKFAGMLA